MLRENFTVFVGLVETLVEGFDLLQGFCSALIRHGLVEDDNRCDFLVMLDAVGRFFYAKIDGFLAIAHVVYVVSQSDVRKRDAQGFHVVERVLCTDDDQLLVVAEFVEALRSELFET